MSEGRENGFMEAFKSLNLRDVKLVSEIHRLNFLFYVKLYKGNAFLLYHDNIRRRKLEKKYLTHTEALKRITFCSA